MLELLASGLRLSTPLIFAAMGGLLCERSGIATICLEGVMIAAAWAAAVVNYETGSPWLGLIAAMGAGAIAMGLHALLSVGARADQIVSGVAVNMAAAGVTPLFLKALYMSPTNSPAIDGAHRFTSIKIPLLGDIPGLGPLLFQHPPLIYLALATPFLFNYLIYRTAPGLRLLAAGDGPDALRAAGGNPARTRYIALLLGGVVAALGGAYLSISHGSQFTRDMTAGRGFIALTALIFGKWRPLPTLCACLFFGFTDALQIRLQSAELGGIQIPVQFIQALPYVVTLLVLIGFVGKARPPLAIGAHQPNQ